MPVISRIERVSRPGCRVYVGSKEVPRVLGGLGINILTTPRGVMTGRRRARKASAAKCCVRFGRAGLNGVRIYMSRVGKKPIPLPKGVKITIGDELTVEGPKGKQTVPIPAGITLRQKDGMLEVLRDGDEQGRAAWADPRAGRERRRQGVSTGFHARACISSASATAADVKGRIATFTLGYSHPIEFYLPDGVDMKVDKRRTI